MFKNKLIKSALFLINRTILAEKQCFARETRRELSGYHFARSSRPKLILGKNGKL